MRPRLTLGLLAASLASGLLVSGCDRSVSLTLDLRTDWVPGAELRRTEVSTDGTTVTRRFDALQAPPVVRGIRLAEITGLVPAGGRVVEVRLLGAGDALLADARVVLDNRADRVHTVVIERRCAGVVCGDGERCVGGVCQDARCLTGAEPECVGGCASDAACDAPRASCATARCLGGVCFATGGGCADGFYCDPSAGCAPSSGECDGGECGGVPWPQLVEATSQITPAGIVMSGGGPVVAGSVRGAVTHGGEELSAIEGERGMVIAFDAAGERRWHQRLDATSLWTLRDVQRGPDGSLVTVGAMSGRTSFGGSTHDAGSRQEPVLATIGADGLAQPPVFFGSSGANAQGRGLAVDGDVVAAAGLYGGALTVLGTRLPDASAEDGWVALAADGELAFAYPIAGGANTFMNAVALGPDRACFGGRLDGDATFPGGAESLSPSRTEGFVVCYGLDGAYLWHATLDGNGNTRVTQLAMLADGALAVAGEFRGEVSVGGSTPVPGFGDDDVFVSVFEPDGALRWLRVSGGPGTDLVGQVATSGRRTLAFVGTLRSDGAIFGAPVPVGGWLVELDPMNGEVVGEVRAFPSTAAFYVRGVVWDESRGSFMAAGDGSGEITLGGMTVTPAAQGMVVFEVR